MALALGMAGISFSSSFHQHSAPHRLQFLPVARFTSLSPALHSITPHYFLLLLIAFRRIPFPHTTTATPLRRRLAVPLPADSSSDSIRKVRVTGSPIVT